MQDLISHIPPDRPVLIAGATASGKSALALRIAQEQGGVVVNADALQVYAGWRILTARPSQAEMAGIAHHLYGHVPLNARYSVGQWLDDIRPLLAQDRVIIVGGTGLYFRALTEGLADIPDVPAAVMQEAETTPLPQMIANLDDETRARLDLNNPARVARAWAVWRATGRSITQWQRDTPPPILPLSTCTALHLDAPKEWLNPRIETRFHQMLDQGALEEAQLIAPDWNPHAQSARAIGAAELIAHIRGEMTLETATERAIIASQQYAKRQRTWFRNRMKGWQLVQAQ